MARREKSCAGGTDVVRRLQLTRWQLVSGLATVALVLTLKNQRRGPGAMLIGLLLPTPDNLAGQGPSLSPWKRSITTAPCVLANRESTVSRLVATRDATEEP